MTRPSTARQSWRAWFEPRFKATGLSGNEFADRILEAGGKASKQAVSQWANGENTAEPNSVVIIATLFDEDPAEALRAAGHGIVADVVAGTLRLAGARPTPLDEGIRRILARDDLTPKRQARIIESYRRRAELLLEDLEEMIAAVADPGRESDGESGTS
jgi:transcriptional regulator with XRE-family HTH domain